MTTHRAHDHLEDGVRLHDEVGKVLLGRTTPPQTLYGSRTCSECSRHMTEFYNRHTFASHTEGAKAA
ncbi:hypothetical protein BH23ACT6_BH23ACT6_10350 [soil metagenome]